jgi:benzoyl-CoA reductase/2-hydroxyglutaryl-CoA dehydratase subunit BcrC/BadD/HgdB
MSKSDSSGVRQAQQPDSPPAASKSGIISGLRKRNEPLDHFNRMLENCQEHARAAKEAGRPIVGLLCESIPRELILAAGGVPVNLCGGSVQAIAGAEEDLPANICPLIKSTYGYHVLRSNPLFEMADLLVGETTCDGKRKMFELLGESRPSHIVELPQNKDDPDAMGHWERELRKLKQELESRFRVEISDGKILNAIRVMNCERSLRRELASLMKQEGPPLTGRDLLRFRSVISGIAADFDQYERALQILSDAPAIPGSASRVRVLLTGVPTVHGAERVVEIIEDHGGLVVCMENCAGLKPILEDADTHAADPIQALARKYSGISCASRAPNSRRLELLRKLAADFRAECVIELIWRACLIYDIESVRVKRLVQKELALPYLRIETDYSPADSESIAARVKSLFETVRQARRSKEKSSVE